MAARNETIPAAPYSYRPPSPPFIHIPVVQRDQTELCHPLDLMPSYEHVDPAELTSNDITIITRNVVQIATDRAATWYYEQRREAQSILDFLYLGPTAIIRNHDFLRDEGITLVMVVRDARQASRTLASVDKATAALGIPAVYLDIQSPFHLVGIFPDMIRQINRHLLDVYHGQAQGKDETGQVFVKSDNFRHGRVLVTCETGNDRSAAVVAAYIMAMFRKDMVTTLQFINVQRFCCGFDEDLKRALFSWQDIVRAQSAVIMDSRFQKTSQAQGRPAASKSDTKRRLDDMMDDYVDGHGAAADSATDRERFSGREAFVPFMDVA
ncbi:hypothetical protein PT974_09786 [Cladobotryum mycophilum]|uniref:Tyrosine-protein phosphatase domain-containing protein n=1 Tax=Cladobotryum mycophilum TaxID=491253 RepID=A0ABR0SH78_9HYPO